MNYWPGRSWKKEFLEFGKIIATVIIGIIALIILIYVFKNNTKALLSGLFLGILLTLFIKGWKKQEKI